jgi:hypothetical protein
VLAGGAYLFIALCFGLAGGLIGRMKGGPFLLWFLISALIPFIGLACAVLYRDERDEPLRLCPGCGTTCKLYQAKCLRCGYELAYPEPDEILAPRSAAPV